MNEHEDVIHASLAIKKVTKIQQVSGRIEFYTLL